MQPELQPLPGRDAQRYYGDTAALQHGVARNTYWLLAISLIPTAIGAIIGTNMDWSFLAANRFIGILLIAVAYGLMFGIQYNRTSGWGVGLLLLFTLYMGVLLGPLMQHVLGYSNGGELVAMAAGGTAAVFFVMAGIASTTRRDLSGLGNFLAVGGVVLLLAMLASFFFHSPLFILAILAAFILFSSLIILWQVNAIVRGGETNYISATLTLYVAIYNLFSALLQILGAFGGNNRN